MKGLRLKLGLAAAAVVGAILGIVLVWLIIRGLDWTEAVRLIRTFPPVLFVGGVGLVVLGGMLRAARWRLLLVGEPVTARRLFLVEHTADGLNYLSPVRVLSEPFQLSILTFRDKLPSGKVLAAMAAARTMSAVMYGVVLGIALTVIPGLAATLPLATGVLLLAAVGVATAVAVATARWWLPVMRSTAVGRQFGASLTVIRAHPVRVAGAFTLTVAYGLALGLTGWSFSHGIGYPLPVTHGVIVMLAAQAFVIWVPGLPAGIGNFEFAAVFILGFMGVPNEAALTFGALAHAAVFLPPLIVAAVMLPREGWASLRGALNGLRAWRGRT